MKRGTPRHPKTVALQKVLKVSLPAAVGYLELLFHFTAEFAPQGNIGKYPDDWIEANLHWKGRRGALIEALIETGWLDPNGEEPGTGTRCRLVVHHWMHHADESVRLRLKRSKMDFFYSQSDSVIMSEHRGTSWPPPHHQPEPKPKPKPQVAATAPFLPPGFDDEKRTQTSGLSDDDDPALTFSNRLHARHSEADCTQIEELVRRELKGTPMREFIQVDQVVTTSPLTLRNPIGYYRGLARHVALTYNKNLKAQANNGKVLETPRCEQCRGTGRRGTAHCVCELGLLIAKMEGKRI